MGSDTVYLWLSDQGDGNTAEIASDVAISAKVAIQGRANRLVLGSGVMLDSDDPSRVETAITISGDRNEVIIGPGCRLNISLCIEGDDCRIVIGADCILTFNANLRAGGLIEIGDGTTMVKGAMQVHERATIRIGCDCMVSTLVYISVSDIHPIYDRANGERINPPASVTIGDHVWLGLRSMIMKGAHIEAGAVVAAGAVVSGHVPAASIVAGAPAKVLRQDIEWRRDFK